MFSSVPNEVLLSLRGLRLPPGGNSRERTVDECNVGERDAADAVSLVGVGSKGADPFSLVELRK